MQRDIWSTMLSCNQVLTYYGKDLISIATSRPHLLAILSPLHSQCLVVHPEGGYREFYETSVN